MPKSIRAQLVAANQTIRDLKNHGEEVVFPLRKKIAEQERELASLTAQLAVLRAEYRHIQLLAMYIGTRAGEHAGTVASGKVLPVRFNPDAPHFLYHNEIGRTTP